MDAGSRDALRSTARDRGELNESYAIVRPLAAPGAEVRLSDKAWAAYFPTLTKADLARVPDMLADGTAWPHYAESIDDFIGAAVSLRTLLTSLREPKRRGFDASSGLLFLVPATEDRVEHHRPRHADTHLVPRVPGHALALAQRPARHEATFVVGHPSSSACTLMYRSNMGSADVSAAHDAAYPLLRT